MISERFLLCRPQGGLNDMLCNIEKARLYADKFNRNLIVDTNFVNSKTILGDFSDYFHTSDDVFLNTKSLINKLDNLTIFPPCVNGQLDKYHAYYDRTLANFAERTTSQRISFRFDSDYEEQLLVHHACGGGILGVQALSWLQLNDVITAELIRRMSVIKSPYCAIHIRNTDYRSDYVHYLNSWKPQLAAWDCTNLFVATDNIECVEYCRNLFSSFKVFSFSWLPKIAYPLHHYTDPSRRFGITADAIVDLLMLALSEHLALIPIAPANPQAMTVQISEVPIYLSGFSLLAHSLNLRRDILHHLVPDVFAKINWVGNQSSQSSISDCLPNFNCARDIPMNSPAPVRSRNAPCPCGSGKRFKHCCGTLV